MLFALGEENSKLLTELNKESKEVARLTVVESEVQRLKVELDDMQAKLKNTSIELGKTQAKNKTMEKHEQVTLLIIFDFARIMFRRFLLCWAKNCLY